MTDSLFRAEASLSERNSLMGVVLLRQPVKYTVLTTITILLVISSLLLLVFGEYSKRITAVGHVSPSKGIIRLFPQQSGVLVGLELAEGSMVKSGQILARVDTQQNSSSDYGTEVKLLKELQESLESIDKRSEAEKVIADLETSRMARKVAAIKASIANKKNQLVTAKKRLASERKAVQEIEALKEKKFLSNKQYKTQNDKLLSAQDATDKLISELANMEAELDDLVIRLKQQPSQLFLRRTELESKRSELNQRLIEVGSRRQSLVVAPISGRVTAIQNSLGQLVSPSRPLMTIIPMDNEFIVELYVPTSSIGSVELEQKVYLRYKAFPYQRYGMYEGKVSEIADSIISRNDLELGTILPNEPLYRIKVRLNQQEIHTDEKYFSLSSGMLLDADIVQESRPIWKWLFEPVFSIGDRI